MILTGFRAILRVLFALLVFWCLHAALAAQEHAKNPAPQTSAAIVRSAFEMLRPYFLVTGFADVGLGVLAARRARHGSRP